MKKLWLLSCILCSVLAQAQETYSINQISYSAQKDVLLGITIDAPDSLVGQSARLVLMISGDTLNEYFTFTAQPLLVQKIALYKGEKLDLSLKYASVDSTWIPEIEFNDRLFPSEENLPSIKNFEGNIWHERNELLFTIEKKDRKAQDLILVIGYSASYEYLESYVRATLVSPDGSKSSYALSMEVEWDQRLKDGAWIGRLPIGNDILSQRGTYYLQISSDFGASRVNGIDFVSYELIE